MEELDWSVGAVVDALERAGVAERTLVPGIVAMDCEQTALAPQVVRLPDEPLMLDFHALELLLAELRLPSMARLWPQFTERADREGWPAARPTPMLMTIFSTAGTCITLPMPRSLWIFAFGSVGIYALTAAIAGIPDGMASATLAPMAMSSTSVG